VLLDFHLSEIFTNFANACQPLNKYIYRKNDCSVVKCFLISAMANRSRVRAFGRFSSANEVFRSVRGYIASRFAREPNGNVRSQKCRRARRRDFEGCGQQGAMLQQLLSRSVETLVRVSPSRRRQPSVPVRPEFQLFYSAKRRLWCRGSRSSTTPDPRHSEAKKQLLQFRNGDS
jgi:hypothetical protein